jgi:type VI secretion system FHA domain protein
MSLNLSVLTYRNQPPPREISKRFDRCGGTIGRQDQSDLVLEDPERVISRTHARIDFRDDAYFITRLGSNAVELNGSPLAADAAEPLSSGDRVSIGEYCLLADLKVDSEVPVFRHCDAVLTLQEDADAHGCLKGGGERQVAFDVDLGGAAPQVDAELLRPEQPPILDAGLQRDRVPGHQEPLPRARPLIPEGYDLASALGLRGPAASATESAIPGSVQAPAASPVDASPMPERIKPEIRIDAPVPHLASGDMSAGRQTQSIELPEHTVAPSQASTQAAAGASEGYLQAVRTLLAGAGLPELEDRVLADPQFMQNVGALLQECISGLRKALIARSLIKQYLHVDMTMLNETENNPVKFSLDAGEALSHLLVKRPQRGYLGGQAAVREAYEDLQAHNLAVVAGMRAALLEVLQRFEPDRLEKRLDSESLLDKVLPLHRKAKLWALAAEQHASLLHEAQDDFDRIFGRPFRTAYEEQARKIRAGGKPSLL